MSPFQGHSPSRCPSPCLQRPINQVTTREWQPLTLGPGRVCRGLPMTFWRRSRCFRRGGRWPPDQTALPARERRRREGFEPLAQGCALHTVFYSKNSTPLLPPADQPPPRFGAVTPLLPLARARGAQVPHRPSDLRPGSGTSPWPKGLGQAGRPNLSHSLPSALPVHGAWSWLLDSGPGLPGEKSPYLS